MRAFSLLAIPLLLLACDEKKDAPASSGSAVATAVPSAPPAPSTSTSTATVAAPSGAPSASAGSSSAMVTGADTDDVSFTAREPGKDGNQTVKAKVGGAFTLFLPDRDGNSWAPDSVGALGKPKEEVIPGFAPGALGHQFKWTGLKAGKTTLTFGYRKASAKGAGAPSQTFKVTVDVL